MTCNNVIKYLEDWAPKDIAWNKDNVGLQIGSTGRKIKNVMLSLDVTENVVRQAAIKNCNLIITHHPLFFKPLKNINIEYDSRARIVEIILKNNITLYSAHTNLDFTKDGVSFSLANKLKLQNIDFLTNLNENQFKLIVFVPVRSIEKVANAIHKAGGGVIGDYTNCSFRINGSGTFKGSNATNPVIGKRNRQESVEEIRFEVLVDSWKINDVIKMMRAAHPYEEVAYDIYPLKNDNVRYGMGVIGELRNSMTKKEFLKHVSHNLKLKNFRFSNGRSGKIKRVAVCGGAGMELLPKAIGAGADVFITADIKYHSFQDAMGKILLIDAGHYETEIWLLDEIEEKLNRFLSKESKIKVYKYKGSTNPVIFYNN